MKVIKLNFAGCTLDAIVGHPEHEVLFVANQVNKAARCIAAPSQGPLRTPSKLSK